MSHYRSFSIGLKAEGDVDKRPKEEMASRQNLAKRAGITSLQSHGARAQTSCLGKYRGSKEKQQGLDRTDLHNSVSHVLCSSELIPLVTFPENVRKLAGNLQHQEER